MVAESIRRVALLSIRPTFAEKIMTGGKRVEFRKTRLKQDLTHVVVYATSPVQRVLGYFEVQDIVVAPPDGLWRRFHAVGGIGRMEYDDYFGNSEMGVAIVVGRVTVLPEPAPLCALGGAISAPQSYRYLPRSSFRQLQTRA